MELKVNFAKIVGTPKEGRDSWVEVVDGLFLVLEIVGPRKEIIDEISESYKSLPQKNLANLEGLVREIVIEEGVSLSLVAGMQIGKVFYLVCRGGGKVILRREGKFGIILEGKGSASGLLEDKDVLVLASPRFWEIVSFEEVKNVFDHFSASELAEGLTPLVHRAEDTSGVACLILQFEKIEKEEWEEEVEETPAFSGEAGFGEAKENSRQMTEEERKKRVVFWVAVILVILLGVSIIFGLGKKVKTQRESRFSQTYELASHQYEEGKALLGLNNLRATTLLTEAKTSLGQLKSIFGKGSPEAKKIEELLTKIEQGLAETSQVFKIQPEIFLDLGLIKEGGEGQRLAINEDIMAVLDNKNSSLYQVIVPSKSSQILAGGDKITGATLVALGEEMAYVLTNEGITEVELKNKSTRVVIEKDSDWGEIVDMVSFAGNLYLLDKTNEKIWKYTGSESGSFRKSIYSDHDRGLNRDNLSSMAIDGSVWLAGKGKISKFVQGKEEVFAIQGLDQPLGQDLAVFSSAETKNLYFFDKANKRIVVLEKTGTYKSQYILEGVGEIKDMVVSEGEKKVFLLSGSKIYEIGIK